MNEIKEVCSTCIYFGPQEGEEDYKGCQWGICCCHLYGTVADDTCSEWIKDPKIN